MCDDDDDDDESSESSFFMNCGVLEAVLVKKRKLAKKKHLIPQVYYSTRECMEVLRLQ